MENKLNDNVIEVTKDDNTYYAESERIIITLEAEDEGIFQVTQVSIKDYLYPSDVSKSIKHAVRLATKLQNTD
ncbi:hypothetical protein HOS78_gp052 [Lactobacillus phage Bacchae]|uniref:Uncharacterized protein n=1 Tax=Lactobacillus phage Bacchae TaxID=2079429 RepID=A0A2K9VCP5_9CAUD|nr:hypothetical protein HOS78_gp052 [Lactobacillus phage Bacchae]AUV59988.1 hypothetical protein [Lactobacillus phage Bacchae]